MEKLKTFFRPTKVTLIVFVFFLAVYLMFWYVEFVKEWPVGATPKPFLLDILAPLPLGIFGTIMVILVIPAALLPAAVAEFFGRRGQQVDTTGLFIIILGLYWYTASCLLAHIVKTRQRLPRKRSTRNSSSRGSAAVFLLVVFVLLVTLIAIRAGRIRQNPFVPSSAGTLPTGTSSSVLSCSRETPYPNPPEINSAISLVFDRIGAKLGKDRLGEGVAVIGDNWMNCINAAYQNLPTGVEGAFVFDKNSSVDDLKVMVDVGYKQYDDLLRGMLLSHELRHVLQFLEFKASGKEAGCVDQEVQAFQTQFIFFLSLSESERLSLRQSTRSHLTAEPYAPLVSMYEMYQQAKRSCGRAGEACISKTVTNELRSSITSNPYYQKECAL